MRDNLLTAITRRKDSPPTVANLAMSAPPVRPKHPYGWPMTGVEAQSRSSRPEELRAFYDKYYRPNNAALMVAGDTTVAALRASSKPRLASGDQGVGPPKLPAAAGAARHARVPDRQGRGAAVVDPRRHDRHRTHQPRLLPVTVMNLILGGGFYRLDLNLREGKGWTYGARSTLDSRRTPGPFSAGGEFVAQPTAPNPWRRS